MDIRGDDRVDIYRFVLGCRAWGYGGNAEFLFDLLDLDKAGYLSLASTRWIGGGEDSKLFEDEEGMAGLGQFAGLTRAQARKLDFKLRDIRMQKERFAVNSRRDHAGIQVSNETLRRSLSCAIQCHPKGQAFLSEGAYNDLESIPITRKYKPFLDAESSVNKNLAIDAKKKFTQSQKSPMARSMSSTSGFSPSAATNSGSMLAPGKGGWTMSRLGMARITNKEWRESTKVNWAALTI